MKVRANPHGFNTVSMKHNKSCAYRPNTTDMNMDIHTINVFLTDKRTRSMLFLGGLTVSLPYFVRNDTKRRRLRGGVGGGGTLSVHGRIRVTILVEGREGYSSNSRIAVL